MSLCPFPIADLELFFNLKILHNVSNIHNYKFSTISQESIQFQKKIAKENSFIHSNTFQSSYHMLGTMIDVKVTKFIQSLILRQRKEKTCKQITEERPCALILFPSHYKKMFHIVNQVKL